MALAGVPGPDLKAARRCPVLQIQAEAEQQARDKVAQMQANRQRAAAEAAKLKSEARTKEEEKAAAEERAAKAAEAK